jgi:hypothetical protein
MEGPTVRAAKELEWMAHAAHIELHGVGVQSHGDGPVSEKPLCHLRLILGDLQAARHARYNPRPVNTKRITIGRNCCATVNSHFCMTSVGINTLR